MGGEVCAQRGEVRSVREADVIGEQEPAAERRADDRISQKVGRLTGSSIAALDELQATSGSAP